MPFFDTINIFFFVLYLTFFFIVDVVDSHTQIFKYRARTEKIIQHHKTHILSFAEVSFYLHSQRVALFFYFGKGIFIQIANVFNRNWRILLFYAILNDSRVVKILLKLSLTVKYKRMIWNCFILVIIYSNSSHDLKMNFHFHFNSVENVEKKTNYSTTLQALILKLFYKSSLSLFSLTPLDFISYVK